MGYWFRAIQTLRKLAGVSATVLASHLSIFESDKRFRDFGRSYDKSFTSCSRTIYSLVRWCIFARFFPIAKKFDRRLNSAASQFQIFKTIQRLSHVILQLRNFAPWRHILSLSEQTPYTRYVPLWCLDMDTRLTLLVFCVGNPPITGGCPHKGPVKRNFYVFFDVSLINMLIKQSSWCWFGTPCRSYDVTVIPRMMHTNCRVWYMSVLHLSFQISSTLESGNLQGHINSTGAMRWLP